MDEVPDDIDQTPRYIGPDFEIGADEILATGIINSSLQPLVNLYPNPVIDKFIITSANHWMLAGKIQVFNAIGMQINADIVTRESGYEVNLMGQPEGIYIVKILSGKSLVMNKLILCRN